MISIYFFAIYLPSKILKLRTDDQYLKWPVLGPGIVDNHHVRMYVCMMYFTLFALDRSFYIQSLPNLVVK